jgi:hypothetical protein
LEVSGKISRDGRYFIVKETSPFTAAQVSGEDDFLWDRKFSKARVFCICKSAS